jgi:hypothetical protein
MKGIFALLLSILMFIPMSVHSLPGEEEAPSNPMPAYLSVTGVVTQVDDYLGADEALMEGWRYIRIEDENGGPVTLLTTDQTCYTGLKDIKPGDTVAGYYDALAPMILIYPPQHTVKVLAVNLPDSQSVKVDRFSIWSDGPEGFYVSDDGMLAFKVDETTEIRSLHASMFNGNFDGLHLAVIYDISTRSIPAQTTPIAVIVL